MVQKVIISTAVLVIVGGAVLWGLPWGREKSAPADAKAVNVPAVVTVGVVQEMDLPLTLDVVGRVEARASVAVKSRLDGQIAQVAFTEGQMVHQGQTLLRLEPALLQAQQRQAQALVARDEALLVKTRSDFQRNQKLQEQGFISSSGLSQSQADMQAAQATLAANKASLDGATLQLAYANIVAPMDGIAGALLLPVGGAAKANDTTLLVINQIKPSYVSFALPESKLPALRAALRAGVVQVSATVAGSTQVLNGKLAFVDNAVDASTGSITGKALFTNDEALLTPGQFAQVAIQLDMLSHALVVPSQAVENGVDGPYAFVANNDATVGLRKLTVGAESGTYRVVLSGLKAGERVVTTGQARLRDKGSVTVSSAAAATAGAAP